MVGLLRGRIIMLIMVLQAISFPYIRVILGVPDTNETLSITLNAIGTGSSVSDLNGATVTVTNEDTTETILSTTWSGLVITVKIPMSTNYSVTVGNVSGYITPSSQTYYSSYMGLNDVVFNYASSIGFYISDLDKNLYTAETWQAAISAGKVTVNSALGVAVFTSTQQFIINPNTQACQFGPDSARYTDVTNPPKFTSPDAAATDFNGKSNTNTWTSVYSGNYAANIAKSFRFPDNRTGGYIPAGGQMMIFIQNRSTIYNLFNLFTSQLNNTQYYWTSTNWGYVTDSGSVRIYSSYVYDYNSLYYFRIFDAVNLMVIRDWND